jgi:LuxR family glucitol operon transcriptional activator
MLDFLSYIPDSVKKQVVDELVNFLANETEKFTSDKIANKLRTLSSQAEFNDSVKKAIEKGLNRFASEYIDYDEDLAEAIVQDSSLWKSEKIRKAISTLLKRPGAWNLAEREEIVDHFEDILPKRRQRDRVDKAISYLLYCIIEELWTLPGAKEIRDVYAIQFQKVTAESARQQVALAQQQLQATTQLSGEMRQALVQLTTAIEKKLLAAPAATFASIPHPKPYNNLPRPDYSAFVGRDVELNWIRERLSPTDRAWLVAITGIGGVGKSAIVLRIAHEYCQQYELLPERERFEAIIWVSAKEEVLTAQGKQPFSLPEAVLRTLEDVYTAIAQTLDREDITRALPEERGHLVRKALQEQRTLIVMDNLESVKDERIKPFLRNLPEPTKAIITSREWLDIADVYSLKGLSFAEADLMISEEVKVRRISIDENTRKRFYDLTSGLPLPIKLAIARLAGGESNEAVIRWLGNAVGDVPEYCIRGQAELAKKRNINAWKILLACSLFERGVGASRDALGYIADLSIFERDEGLTQLQHLFLLNCMDNDRFWTLPIVQRYASLQFIEAENAQIISLWLRWLSKFSEDMADEVEWKVELIPVFGVEYANILTALRWCRDQEIWDQLKILAEGLWHYAYITGSFFEFQEILDAAKKAAQITGDEAFEGKVSLQYARLAQTNAEPDEVVESFLTKAEVYARKYANYEDWGEILATRINVFRIRAGINKRDLNENGFITALTSAEYWTEELNKLWEKSGNLHLRYLAAYRFSEIEEEKGNFDKAVEWLNICENCCKEFGGSRLLGTTVLGNRGSIYLKQGVYEKAEEILAQSLDFCTKWGLRRHMAHNKERLARLYARTNRINLARKIGEEACDLYERIGLAFSKTRMENFLRDYLKEL